MGIKKNLFQAVGITAAVLCSGTANAEPTLGGACCLTDGSCVDDVLSFICEAQGGVFQGDSTFCIDTDCSPSGGACCLIDGSCAELSVDECEQLGGEYQGDDTTCAQAECFDIGACCIDSTCVDGLTEPACVAQGGVFQGLATMCADADCGGGGGDGCTPGYWKQRHHFWAWTSPYEPDLAFDAVFEDAFPGKSLHDVLKQGGGHVKALGRHTVAALLNAAMPAVDYDLTVNEVITLFNDAYPGSNNEYEDLKDYFQYFNEQGCPIGNGN